MESAQPQNNANKDLESSLQQAIDKIGPLEETQQREWTNRKLQAFINFIKEQLTQVLTTTYNSERFHELNNFIFRIMDQYQQDDSLKQELIDIKKKLKFETFFKECPVTQADDFPELQFEEVTKLGKDSLAESKQFKDSDFLSILNKEKQALFRDFDDKASLVNLLQKYCEDNILKEFQQELQDISDDSKAELLGPVMKGRSRLIQKIRQNEIDKSGTFRIFDLARASFVCKTTEQLMNALKYALESLGWNEKIVKFDNNLLSNLKNINMVVVFIGKGKNKCLVEVQFLWGERNERSKLNHYYYELSRCDTYTSLMKAVQSHCSLQYQEKDDSSPEKKMPEYAIDKELISLLDVLRGKQSIKTQEVYNLMIKVDRKNFVADGQEHKAYIDAPQPIGWNINLSAAHMYAYALEMLKDTVKAAKKVLVVGTGGGYMATCFAELVTGPQAKVYQIDQVKGLVDQSAKNAMKGNTHLLSKKVLISITQDGRLGLPKYAPYDVIYVGRAVNQEDVEVLQGQISNGGMMWVPTPCDGSQEILWISKDDEGECSKISLMGVRFASLTQAQ